MNGLLLTSLEQGLIFSVLAMGVLISYKILDIADLSVEGTFPFGAFVFAKSLSLGLGPIPSTLLAFTIGTLAGLLTASLFTKLKIKPILAGILTMNILYSVNLNTQGKSNIPLFNYGSVFDNASILVVMIIIVLLIKILMDLFLKTELGYLLIATGDNESLVKSLGKNSDRMKIMGLMISNGLIALSGALMAQSQGFVDITMGRSIIVVALAAIIIGDTIFKSQNKLKNTTRAIIGALIYKLIGGFAINMGLSSDNLEMINALIVIVFIAYNNFGINLLRSSDKGKTKILKGGKSLAKNN